MNNTLGLLLSDAPIKINDCINKVLLLGPFAHGVNEFVKRNRVRISVFNSGGNIPKKDIKHIWTCITNS